MKIKSERLFSFLHSSLLGMVWVKHQDTYLVGPLVSLSIRLSETHLYRIAAHAHFHMVDALVFTTLFIFTPFSSIVTSSCVHTAL